MGSVAAAAARRPPGEAAPRPRASVTSRLGPYPSRRWRAGIRSGCSMYASSRLTCCGMHSFPAGFIRDRSFAHSATAFIDARYWLHAAAKSPSWSSISFATTLGTRRVGTRVEARAPVPEHELARRPRQVSELRKGDRRLPQDRPLRVAEHSLPGLLRIEAIRACELDRLLQVLVVDVQELQRRALLAQQVQQRHGPGSRDALLRKRDLAKLPHGTPGVGVDAAADRREALALEGGTLLRRQQVADVGTHRVGDPEARQQLEVDADPQQPPRFGQVPLLVDDVGDEGARVQRRLVRPDEQHREPRVVRVSGARDAGGGGLARDVGAQRLARGRGRTTSRGAERRRRRASPRPWRLRVRRRRRRSSTRSCCRNRWPNP